jgi:hypothetical protein
MSTYKAFVTGLIKPGDAILASLNDSKIDLLHMVIGVSGEAGELLEAAVNAMTSDAPIDRVNLVEELGDLEFYLEGVQANLEGQIEYVRCGDEPASADNPDLANDDIKSDFVSAALAVTLGASLLLDVTKKNVIYNKQLDTDKVTTAILGIRQGMAMTRAVTGVTQVECIEENIIKLRARYPGAQYSDAAAIARADKV